MQGRLVFVVCGGSSGIACSFRACDGQLYWNEDASTRNCRGSFPRWSSWPQVLNAAWREASRKLNNKMAWKHPPTLPLWGFPHIPRHTKGSNTAGVVATENLDPNSQASALEPFQTHSSPADNAWKSGFRERWIRLPALQMEQIKTPNSGHYLATLIWKVWAGSGEGHSLTLS